MRFLKALLTLTLALSWGQLAYAGSMLSMMGVGPGQNIVPASFQFNASGSSGGNSVTITNSAIGAADPSRLVVVGTTCNSGQTNTISSVTIGGVAATQLAATSGGQINNAAIYALAVPTGTTATIVASYSGTCNAITTVGSWSLYNLNSQTPTGTNAVRGSSPTATATVGVGAFVLGACGGSGANAMSNMTLRWNLAVSSFKGIGGDATSATSSFSSQCTTGTANAVAIAGFK